ncbi:hypothetical protein ONZ45_g15876 [Pleurotus djamor]|nr:hypothetical protein ONZ45_g15876 [Pleurotus djamor]
MDAISSATLRELKSLYHTPPDSLRLHPILDNPWYLVAAVAFNAARRPEVVVSVYNVVLEDLRTHGNGDVNAEDHITLVKKIQEALLKASVTSGVPRALTAILFLDSAVLNSILEKLSSPLRDFDRPFSDLTSQGRQFLSDMFGEDKGTSAHSIINSSSPDMGIFLTTSYGLVLSHCSIVSLLETSYCFITASILDDFPRQVPWFYLAAMRHGASIEEVQAIRDIAIKVASLIDVTFREKVPEVVAKELIQVY